MEFGKINNHAAKKVFELVIRAGGNPKQIVKEQGLEQVESSEKLEKIVLEILKAHPDVAADYKTGKIVLWDSLLDKQ